MTDHTRTYQRSGEERFSPLPRPPHPARHTRTPAPPYPTPEMEHLGGEGSVAGGDSPATPSQPGWAASSSPLTPPAPPGPKEPLGRTTPSPSSPLPSPSPASASASFSPPGLAEGLADVSRVDTEVSVSVPPMTTPGVSLVPRYPGDGSEDDGDGTATTVDIAGLFSGRRERTGGNEQEEGAGAGAGAGADGNEDDVDEDEDEEEEEDFGPASSALPAPSRLLRLDLDGLAGFDPSPPTPPDASATMFEAAILTKGSDGTYPAHNLSSAAAPGVAPARSHDSSPAWGQGGGEEGGLPLPPSRGASSSGAGSSGAGAGGGGLPAFVRRAAEAGAADMAAAAARTAALRPPTAPAGANDAAPPPVPGNGEGGGKATSPGPARRRRPRPWDDLNETSFRSALTDDLGLELEIEEDPEGDPYYDVEGGTGLARGQQRTQAQTQTPQQRSGGGGGGGGAGGGGGRDADAREPGERTPLLSGGGGEDGMRFRSSWQRGAASAAAYAASFAAAASEVNAGGGGGGGGGGAESTATGSTFGAALKWRGMEGGQLRKTSNADEESVAFGSVVKDFIRPLARFGGGGGGDNDGDDGGWMSGKHAAAYGAIRASGSGAFYASRPQKGATFSLALSALTCLHFLVMAFYDIYALVYGWETGFGRSTSRWLSGDGLLANPLIGPPASTLTTYGALSGVRLLLNSEIWRVVASLSLSTSLLQLFLHLEMLKFGELSGFIPGMERRWSSKATAALYLICATCGAVAVVAFDHPADVTGLVPAGLCGLLAAGLAESWLSSIREYRSDRLGAAFDYSGGKQKGHPPKSYGSGVTKILLRPGRTHVYLALEWLVTRFSQSSGWAMGGGFLAGLGCGLFNFAHLLDDGANGSSRGGGGDIAPSGHGYGPGQTTPSRRAMPTFGTPTYSPVPQGADTPPMRRSMLGSPELRNAAGRNGQFFSPDIGDASSPYPTPGRSFYGASPSADEGSVGGGELRYGGTSLTRAVGFFLALSVALIPGAMVAFGSGSVDENLLTESMYGCRSVRNLFEAEMASGYLGDYSSAIGNGDGGGGGGGDGDGDGSAAAWNSEDVWVCSQTCVPIPLERRARTPSSRGGMGMRTGRCSEVGYRCTVGTGETALFSGRWWIPDFLRVAGRAEYVLPVTVYQTADSSGNCQAGEGGGGGGGDGVDDDYFEANDDGSSQNGEQEGEQAADEEEEEEEEGGDGEQQEQQQQQQAYGSTASPGEIAKDLAIDLVEEVVGNAGI